MRLPSLHNPLTVDLRALALMRFFVGLLIVVDIIIRLPDFGVFMTDSGVWSLETSVNYADSTRFSLYWLSGHSLWALVLFGASAFFGVLLALGIRTKLSAVASFVLLVSLHNRAPLLLQGGDNLLLLLVFWGMFLPWGARYSVDEALTESPAVKNNVFLPAGVALLLQVVSVYFFSAILKSGDEWANGSAIYYALSNTEYGIRLASLWRDIEFITAPLTYYVWWLELLAPLLIFIPLYSSVLRLAVFIGFATLEIGFIFNLSVGLFPFISLTSLLVLLPSELFDKIAARRKARALDRVLIYYDGECDFCRKITKIIVYCLGLRSVTSIVPAHVWEKKLEIMNRENSWIVQDSSGVHHYRLNALAVLIENAGRFRRLAWLINKYPKKSARVYRFIADNRVIFSGFSKRLLKERVFNPTISNRWQYVSAGFAAMLLYWNFTTIIDRLSYPEPLAVIKNTLRLDQRWSMFAPYPDKASDRFLIPAQTVGGDLINILHSQEPLLSGDVNTDYPEFFTPYRWRKYLTRMATSESSLGRRQFTGWVCRSLNENRQGIDKIESFNIYRFTQITSVQGQEPESERITIIGRYHCGDRSVIKTNALHNALTKNRILSGI